MSRQALILAACLVIGGPSLMWPHSVAAAAASTINAPAEIAAAIYAATATQQAIIRNDNAELRAKNKAIAKLSAAVETGQATIAELTAQKLKFVAELEARDRAFSAEIAAFRNAVVDIGKTPEGAAALAQYNRGEEREAVAVLKELIAAQTAGAKAKLKIEEAAKLRQVATLERDARDKNKFSTSEVIADYEAVTALDPGVHWDWVELARLYQQAGNLSRARYAAEQSARTADDDRARSVSLEILGDVLENTGDLVGARKAQEESLSIRRALSAADPTSAQAKRDVSVALSELGDVLKVTGDLAGARKAYEEDLSIVRALAAADPISAQAKRDVGISLNQMASIPGSGVTWRDALAHWEQMAKDGVLAPTDQQILDAVRRQAAQEHKP